MNTETTERKIQSAATGLAYLDEGGVAEHLMADGLTPEEAQLIVKAAGILNTPYEFGGANVTVYSRNGDVLVSWDAETRPRQEMFAEILTIREVLR